MRSMSPYVFDQLLFNEEKQNKAYKHEEPRIVTDAEGYQLSRHGGTYVGSENDAYACGRFIRPALTKPITITVVALLL